MGELFLFGIGLLCIAAAVLAVTIARPNLAGGHAFSSPGTLPPMPGRFFRRRFRRWWRDSALRERLRPAEASENAGEGLFVLECAARPVVDIRVSRLVGFYLHGTPFLPDGAPLPRTPGDVHGRPEESLVQFDKAMLSRAMAFGHKLGWRHSNTAVVVPLSVPARTLAGGRGSILQTLLRYGGDKVATAPPLVLLLNEGCDLPDEGMRRRLREHRISFALAFEASPEAVVPSAIEHVFVPADAVLGQSAAARRRIADGRALVATGVADMQTLERLAKAGISQVAGPVFGAGQRMD